MKNNSQYKKPSLLPASTLLVSAFARSSAQAASHLSSDLVTMTTTRSQDSEKVLPGSGSLNCAPDETTHIQGTSIEISNAECDQKVIS